MLIRDEQLAFSLARRDIVLVPTLTMMRAVAGLAARLPTHRTGVDYAHARSTVTAFQRAGVTILAGTDANRAPASPMPIQHGEALHNELGLLVQTRRHTSGNKNVSRLVDMFKITIYRYLRRNIA